MKQASSETQWSREQRHGRQFGGLHAILETRGAFIVVTPNQAFSLAIQISRILFEYFGADADIVRPGQFEELEGGNKIRLLLGSADPILPTAGHGFPVRVDKDKGLVIRDAHGRSTSYGFEDGLGAIFLRPNADGNLELVIWGSDLGALRHAARLVPMLTGVGQPDFVVVSQDCAWKGAAGVRALGYFDNLWGISDRSVVI